MATNRLPNHLPQGYNVQVLPNQYVGQPISHPGQPIYSQPTYFQPMQNNINNNQPKVINAQPQVSRQFFDRYAQPNRVLSPPPVLQTGFHGFHGYQQVTTVQKQQTNQSRQSRSEQNREGQRHSDVNVVMGDLTESMHKKEVLSEKPMIEQGNMMQMNAQQMPMTQGYPIYAHQMNPQMYPQMYQQPQMYPPQYHVNYVPVNSQQMGPGPQFYQQNYEVQGVQPQQQYYYEGQQEEGEDPNDPMVWNRRFFFIFERFEWAYQRCEMLKTDYEEVHQQLKTVDSEQDWNALKQKHEQLLEKFMEFQQEMASVVTENQQLLEQRPQSGEQVWAQRYQQLLENYKGLQDQMENRQNQNTGNNSNDAELSRQFRDLKVQYTKIFNEYKELKRKETRQQSEKQEILQKMEEVMQENEKCKGHIEKINQSYDEMSNAFQQLQSANISLKREMISRPKVDKNQYDRFMLIISEKDDQISQMRRELANREKQRYMMQEQLSVQNNQINSLKTVVGRLEVQTTSGIKEEYNHVLSIKNAEIQQYRKMIQSIEEDYNSKMEAIQEEIRRQNDDNINQLQNEIIQLREKIEESQTTHQLKLSNSQKKITFVEQEATGLQEVINQKNQEIMQLRTLTCELENYKAIQQQCSVLNDEKIQFLNAIKGKDKQIEQLKNSLQLEKAQLRQTFDRKVEMSTRSIIQQLNQVKEIIDRKDNEIQKIRSQQQNKEKLINELQVNSEVERSKNISLQRNFESERDNFRKQIRALETRNNDLDRKLRHLEFDFGESVKTALQSEISTLRSQNHAKQQSIGKLQNSQIELRGRISHLERQKKDLQLNLQDLKSKTKDYNQQRTELNRKIDGLINDVHSRDRIIKTLQVHEQNYKNQMGKLKSQIVENQNTIKVKSSVIEDLQQKIRKDGQYLYEMVKDKDSLKIQINRNKEEYESSIRQVRDQLQQYEDLINSGKLSKQLETVNSQNLQMISSLRLQNDKLKKELTRGYDAEASRVSSLGNSKLAKGGQGLNFIQKRLFDFNSRLQSIIGQDDLKSNRNKQNYNTNPANQHKQEIKSLKGKLAELQNYCSALQVRVGDQIFQTNAQSTVVFAEQQKITQEEIEFHKAQTKEFEERIENLLKVNRQLKSRLDAILKTNSQNSSVVYYKQQLEHTQKNVENVTQKLNKLVDQNRSLRSELANLAAKFSKQYTQRNFETQSKIEEMSRKIRMLEIEKSSAANERASLMHDIFQYESNIEILKSNFGQKIAMTENINDELSLKIQRYENEIRQLSQRQNV